MQVCPQNPALLVNSRVLLAKRILVQLNHGGLARPGHDRDAENVRRRIIADSTDRSARGHRRGHGWRIASQCDAAFVGREADRDADSSIVLQLGDALVPQRNELAGVAQERYS